MYICILTALNSFSCLLQVLPGSHCKAAHHETNIRRELNNREKLLLDRFLLQSQDGYLHVTAPCAGGNTNFDADIRC